MNTATPLFDSLVEEQGYTPGSFKFRTHKQFMADHKTAWGKAAAKKTPAPAKKTAAKKTQPAKG